MATGTPKTLRGDKGFGFSMAEGASAQDGGLSFQRNAVAGDAFDQLAKGQRVAFDVQPDQRDPRRSRAAKVTPSA